MELRYVQPPTVSSIPRNGFMTDKSFLRGHAIINLPTTDKSKCTDLKRIKLLDLRARTSGTTNIKSQAQDTAPRDVSPKDSNLVFVAGATGKVGSRTVRELLKLGFNVRAGVRSVKRAETLVQSVQNMKLEDGAQPIDKLELVECDLEKPGIKRALGNSSVIICCIGASEKEILDVTGPYRIDYQATKNLIDAATSAKVNHFILLTSLGTNKFGFPAAILNLFWGVLYWKRKAEEALLSSGLPYTIVRPGGMERPTDSYKETHNITLSEEDTLFGGQVSNLQVAELMAFMAKNRSLSYCKVVEVIAETSAPLTPIGELLKKIPSKREEVYLSKESDDTSGSLPVPDSTYTEKEPGQTKPTVTTPLSPYIAYADLKPPTSPTPTQSTSSGSGASKDSKTDIAPNASPVSSSTEVNSSETSSIVIDNTTLQNGPKKQYPLSPYINYEDLKPPSSPTPTPSNGFGSLKASTPEIVPNAASSSTSFSEVNSVETPSVPIDIVSPEISSTKPNPSSPYAKYNDLTPPSSTSTSVPTVTPGNNKPEEKTGNVDHSTESKAQPLSPYTMYDDLKPPSSPVPSPRKL